jgi:hypothetical protein
LPQTVCSQCSIRQFHCPECGHHQPINTLRPAFQRLLGRARALLLALVVFIKLNFFGWILFAWFAGGYDLSDAQYEVYQYGNGRGAQFVAQGIPLEAMLLLSLLALLFGMVGRMLLLRWRRGYLVGLALAALVVTALSLGAQWRHASQQRGSPPTPSPFTTDFLSVLALIGISLVLGATIVWGIWVAITHVFLPRRLGNALLDYQRSLSDRSAASLARD